MAEVFKNHSCSFFDVVFGLRTMFEWVLTTNSGSDEEVEEQCAIPACPPHLTDEQSLHLCISQGSESSQRLEVLIRLGHIDVDKPIASADILEKRSSFGFEGMTPLMSAIHYRNVDAVKILLKYGADPNFQIPSDCDSLCSFNDRIQQKLFRGTTALLFIILVICEENRSNLSDLSLSIELMRSETAHEQSKRRQVEEERLKVLIEIANILLSAPSIDVALKDINGSSPLSLIPNLTSSNRKFKCKELSKLTHDIVSLRKKQCQISSAVKKH